MTADHDTTPIPTDVLRAWVESLEPFAGWRGDEGEALYAAAVAALDSKRGLTAIWVPTDELRAGVEADREGGTHYDKGADQSETPGSCLAYRLWAAAHRAVAALPPPRRSVTRETPNGKRVANVDGSEEVLFVGPDPQDPEVFAGCPTDPTDDPQWYRYDDGWYEVDEPEPLPGTRVGERMTEHTPVGADISPAHLRGIGPRTIARHGEHAGEPVAYLCSGGFALHSKPWTVVALPEESER